MYKIDEDNNPRSIQCLSCKKDTITHETYQREQRNGQNYHLDPTGSYANTIEEFITKVIVNLNAQGFTQNEINLLSHFSLARVRKVIKTGKESTTLKHIQDFFKWLGMDAEIYNNYKNGQISYEHHKELVIALYFSGCDYKGIAQLLKISKRDISLYLKGFLDAKYENSSSYLVTDDELIKLIKKRHKYTISFRGSKEDSSFKAAIKVVNYQ